MRSIKYYSYTEWYIEKGKVTLKGGVEELFT